MEGEALSAEAVARRTVQRVRLLAVLAGAFPALDTAVNIAFPAIDEHFDLDVADLQWIVISYLFTYGALLIVAGRLGDSIGHRRMVAIGGVVSVVGLGGCAVAPTFGTFLAARVVQGVGTALVLAGAPALLTTSAPGDEARGQAVSWFQAASMAGLAIGPVIGGPLVAWAGWRAVYWMRVPVALALVALAGQFARSTRAGPRTDRPDSAHRSAHAGASRGSWRQLAALPGFTRSNVLTAVANAAMFPTWLLVPTLLIDELGLAVVGGGLALSASPAMSAAGSLWVGRRLARNNAAALSRLGLLVEAVGLGVLALVAGSGSIPAIVGGMALVGLGLGLFSVPNMHVVMSSLPLDRQGVAGGLSLMMRTIGVVLGVLAASALFDPIETSEGFDTAFRVVFATAAVIALAAAALSTPQDNDLISAV